MSKNNKQNSLHIQIIDRSSDISEYEKKQQKILNGVDILVFNTCYPIIKDLIENKSDIPLEKLMDLTIKTIKIVQQYSNSSGYEKKKIVIGIIKYIVIEHYKNSLNMDIINEKLHLIDLTLPYFIDISISIAKGNTDIGKHIMQIKNCCVPKNY